MLERDENVSLLQEHFFDSGCADAVRFDAQLILVLLNGSEYSDDCVGFLLGKANAQLVGHVRLDDVVVVLLQKVQKYAQIELIVLSDRESVAEAEVLLQERRTTATLELTAIHNCDSIAQYVRLF